MLGERGDLQKGPRALSPTGARDGGWKDAAICGVTSRSADYVES
jgi:hypothetical protein